MLLKLMILVLLSTLAWAKCSSPQCQPEMQAYVATAAGEAEYRAATPIPQIGTLHSLYQLPAHTKCEVLLRVHTSSVNPSDVSPTIARYPKVLGSDVAGVVHQVGEGCTRLAVGDRVWGDIGANTLTSSGNKTKELGGYAEWVVALESQLAIVPEAWSWEQAGSLPKVALTSYKALAWYAGAPWKTSPTVLVLGGSGGCGGTGIQLARALGAGEIVTTTSAGNSEYCVGLGANRTIDYHKDNWWEVIGDNSVDVIYDTVGQNETGNRAMPKLKPQGWYVTITGQLADHTRPGRHQNMFINSDTNLVNFEMLNELGRFGQAGALFTRVNQTLGLAEVGKGFELSRTGHVVGKLVISADSQDMPI